MTSYDLAMSFLSKMFYEEKGKCGTIAVSSSALSAIPLNIYRQTFEKDDPGPFRRFSMHVWQNACTNTVRRAMVCDVHFPFSKML